jgi:hypothetical protein
VDPTPIELARGLVIALEVATAPAAWREPGAAWGAVGGQVAKGRQAASRGLGRVPLLVPVPILVPPGAEGVDWP